MPSLMPGRMTSAADPGAGACHDRSGCSRPFVLLGIGRWVLAVSVLGSGIAALDERRSRLIRLRGYWLALSCLASGGRPGFSRRGRAPRGGRRGGEPPALAAATAPPPAARGRD